VALRIAPAAMVRKREPSGYWEFMPRKIRISRRMSLWRSSKMVGCHEHVATETETDARLLALFTAAGIFVAGEKFVGADPSGMKFGAWYLDGWSASGWKTAIRRDT
jgi:hypothetical protein